MVQIRISDAWVTAHEAPSVRTHCLQLTRKERDGSCTGGGGTGWGGEWLYSSKIPIGSINIPLCHEKLELMRGWRKEEQNSRIKRQTEEQSATWNLFTACECHVTFSGIHMCVQTGTGSFDIFSIIPVVLSKTKPLKKLKVFFYNTLFRHTRGVTLGMAMLVGTTLWFRLKYLNKYWSDCHEILYRHLWSLEE